MKQKLLLKSMLLLFALIAGSSSAWAATTTYQHVFNAKPSTGDNVTLSSVKWTISATELGSYNSANYAGVQIGTSKKDGSITLTSSSAWGSETGTYKDKTKITEVRLWLNLGGTSVTPTVTIGGKAATSDGTTVVKNSSAGTDWTKATKVTFTPAADGNTGVVVINVATVKAGYICCMEIDCEEAGGGSTPSITLISNSINATKAEKDGSINVTYNNIASVDAEVNFYQADGITPETYSWITANINASNNVEYHINANTGSARTAYMKVHQKTEDVYSELITITQASGIDTPTFDPVEGIYTTAQNVTISCATDGATIYYTTDGSDPDDGSSVYSGAVQISVSGTVLKAIAYKAGACSEIASATYTIKPNAPTSNLDGGSYFQGTEITFTSAGNTVYYNLTTGESTPSNPTNASTEYTDPIVLGSGKTIIKAIAYDTYGNASSVITRTYTGIPPTSLPFSWTGTSDKGKDDLANQTGVILNLASDYATSNKPYRLKFDGTDKYVMINTNEKPGTVTFTAKLFNATTTGSKMKVQASADGIDFTDIEEFTIDGAANATFEFTTSNAFAATHRTVKLALSVKDQNVGVGTISISPATISYNMNALGWSTFSSTYALDFEHATPSGLTAYMVTGTSGRAEGSTITTDAVNNVPGNTGLLLNGAKNTTYTIPVLASSSTVTTSNLMKAVVDATTVNYNDDNGYNYVLVANGATAEFQQIVSGEHPSADIAAGKAYLSLTAPSAPTLSLNFDDITGINAVNGEGFTVNDYYNLNGQRVAQPTKGLYIVNGRKVVIK